MNQIKQNILDSTLLLVTDSGFQGASISKIILKSGVSNGGIYSSFGNRDAIFEALYLEIKRELKEYVLFNIRANQSCHSALYEYWTARISFGLKEKNKLKYLDLFYGSPYYSNLNLSNNYEVLNEILSNSIKSKEIVDLDVDFLLIDINSNVNSVLKYLDVKSIECQQDFIDMTFKKYWRSIINLNLY